VTITGPYPFQVEYASEVRPAAQKHELTLPADTVTRVTLINANVFLNTTLSLSGEAGTSKTVSAPPVSSLKVHNSFNEMCQVAIDGRIVGLQPVTRSVAVGQHDVSLKCGNGPAPSRLRVLVSRGQPALVTFTKSD
jgi:hypothetical protein